MFLSRDIQASPGVLKVPLVLRLRLRAEGPIARPRSGLGSLALHHERLALQGNLVSAGPVVLLLRLKRCARPPAAPGRTPAERARPGAAGAVLSKCGTVSCVARRLAA